MKKPCEGKDEALLQMVHGQLPGWQALMLRYHADRCPECRTKLRRYGALSSALARTLASPSGPRSLSPIGLRYSMAKGAVVSLSLLALLVSYLAIKGTIDANSPQPPSGATSMSVDKKSVLLRSTCTAAVAPDTKVQVAK